MSESDFPYTIWNNGGGRIGRFVTIGKQVYVDEKSEISGHCELYGEDVHIQNSSLDGWCLVTNGDISNSQLNGFVRVDGFEIKDSYLSGDIVIHNSYVEGCHLEAPAGQQIRVVQDSKLYQNSCYGPIFVSGTQMQACEILPLTRVEGGFWSVTPKIKRTGTQFQLCEAVDGQILIGCKTEKLATWQAMVGMYRRLGHIPASHLDVEMFNGLQPEEIEAIAVAIERW